MRAFDIIRLFTECDTPGVRADRGTPETLAAVTAIVLWEGQVNMTRCRYVGPGAGERDRLDADVVRRLHALWAIIATPVPAEGDPVRFDEDLLRRISRRCGGWADGLRSGPEMRLFGRHRG